ncbi:hypothetical protein POM88_025850 [Heracleum sosnowskyi]|uniref:Uncharacterized protein n=1 Tax=Heracleum sosnowskyi TaxID=360622 RepID=A0AAD8I5U0_9APIA|nr:hypothetical protein POM88_025850 [Heracleum sosnowskyi]
MVYQPNFIQFHKFELKELEDVYVNINFTTADQNPTYALDIAGVVEDIEPVTVIQTVFGDRYFLRFRLSNGRMSVKVSLLDDEILMLDPIKNGNFEDPPIIVFASCRACS